MSIVTKGGDRGTTGLMYNRRVSKCHPRVEAYGAVDELNAAIGLARAATEHDSLRENLMTIQKDLVILMGELAAAVEDLPRYVKDGHALVTPAITATLEKWIAELEAAKVFAQGWAMPGANAGSAALDFARTVCRRAERRSCGLQEASQLDNPEIVVYLNRLSDLLWLLARWAEGKPSPRSVWMGESSGERQSLQSGR
jgi:cob(I)alamin adenosyltransferase